MIKILEWFAERVLTYAADRALKDAKNGNIDHALALLKDIDEKSYLHRYIKWRTIETLRKEVNAHMVKKQTQET